MSWSELHLICPELWLLTIACSVLVFDAFQSDKHSPITFGLACIGALGAFILSCSHGGPFFDDNPVASLRILNNLLVIDALGFLTKAMTAVLTLGVFIYSRQYIKDREIPCAEFYVMSLLSLIGMYSMISANHFFSLYLGLELLSLPLYAMVALQRNNGATSEAAIKYFVMGALASGLLLYGISLIYGMTGSLEFQAVAAAIASGDHSSLLIFGLVFVITGLAFKLGAVPFHMWIPDVYQGAPASVTLFIATAPKVAALVMMLRLLVGALPELVDQWQQLLIMLSIASMGLGNLVALMQTNLRRLLAYSAIAHVGYLLLGIISGTEQGYSASLFYIIIYGLMTLGAFGMVTLLSVDGHEFERIDDLKGLNSRHPWMAFLLLLIIFSMAGIPPTVGFFAKLSVLQALVASGFVWLAVVALIFAVFGAFYYIRLVKVMYFEEPDIDDARINLGTKTMTLISINGVLLLLLGIAPGALIALCQAALRAL